MEERPFSSLGPTLRLLGLALAAAAFQALRDTWGGLPALIRGGSGAPLPSGAGVVFGLAAIAAGAFFLRQAHENAQALAGGGQVLPPLSLIRLLQPRYEHPLNELWTRSDPARPLIEMPRSASFAALWGLALAIAVPLWAFALVSPFSGRLATALDLVHHAATVAACALAFHFAAKLTERQDEAWLGVKPAIVPPALRVVGKKAPAEPAPAPPGPAAIAAAPPTRPALVPTPAPASAAPLVVKADPPSACAICKSAISGRRCEACGAPVLAAGFRVVASLGGSGARRTFLAEAPDGAKVVLKELAIATAPGAESLEAFAREAKMLRELRHPKLPVYVDAFQEEEGPRARLYLAYRYLEGVSLHQEMSERPYTEDEVLSLVEEVLEILRHLHGLQPPLIHRDIKPANLVRRKNGQIALIDFGVARSLERTINSGTMVGTVGYMPPEQLAGQVDLTCDLYALGATALHLLTRTAPWEFMDGPELRLPPLKTARTARAFLQRMVAPRRARRFSSAREALLALRRMRSGGFRVPKIAVAASAVAAATVAATVFGANRRLAAPPAATTTTSVVHMPVADPVVSPVRAPAPEPVRALVTWKGGALTADQVRDSLRRLPPWLKNEQPWWIQQHVLAQVKRKLLAADAEKRGLGADIPRAAPDRERLLAKSLLDLRAQSQGELNPARAQRKAWMELTSALLSESEVRVDDVQIFQLDRKLYGALPPGTPESGARQSLEFIAATGRCVIEVEPQLRRYGGRCEASASLAQAMIDPDTLQLLDLSSLPAGFYTRYTDDFVPAAQLRRNEGLEASRLAEDALTGASFRIAEAGGTLSFLAAQGLLGAAEPALRRCLAAALQQSPSPRLKAAIRIDLEDGAVRRATVDTEPLRLPAGECARTLSRPELTGSGTLLVVAELTRAVGRPAPSAAPIRPAVHQDEPPVEEYEEE